MMERKHGSAAERQRAHRQRVKDRLAGLQAPAVVAKPARRPSRPKRLASAVAELLALQGEYESWLDALPENLEESSMATQLREAIEQLQVAIDATEEVIPPLGFGR